MTQENEKRSWFCKLILSNLQNEETEKNVPNQQWSKIVCLWNNTTPKNSNKPNNAIGIERVFRIFLVFTQFFTIGLYVRWISAQWKKLGKIMSTDVYVILKLCVAFLILYLSYYNNSFIKYYLFLSIFETLTYLANLVFNDDIFTKPHSYKRNIILTILDYIEINFCFASLYLATKSIYRDGDLIANRLDALYFSFVSSFTIGYGDITPHEKIGKYMVISQAIIFLIFGVVFLNFYSSKLNESSNSTQVN